MICTINTLLCIYFVIMHLFCYTLFQGNQKLFPWLHDAPISQLPLQQTNLKESISSLSILSSTHTTGLLCYPWSERAIVAVIKDKWALSCLKTLFLSLCTFSLISPQQLILTTLSLTHLPLSSVFPCTLPAGLSKSPWTVPSLSEP